MLNENKKIGIIIFVVALLLIGFLAFWIYNFNKSKQASPSPKTTAGSLATSSDSLMETALKNPPKVEYKFDQKAEDARELTAEDVRKMSLSFAERFGSYSNQSNYENIEDLKIFMTSNMKTWADGYIIDLKKLNKDTTNYFGIITLAINGEVKKFDKNAGVAEVLVYTQRRELGANSAEIKVYNQNITLNFVKSGSEWKVDSAYWAK
jgi:hypothetical protein